MSRFTTILKWYKRYYFCKNSWQVHRIRLVWDSRYEHCTNGECTFRVQLCQAISWEYCTNLIKSIWKLLRNHSRRQCSTKPHAMNTNRIISVFNMEPYMSKYKSYCTPTPSDFLEKNQSVINTLIIVNSIPSNVKTGHWLCIFQTAKNIECFDPLGLPSFYTLYINSFIESSGKTIIQNQKIVQDLTTKSPGFNALLCFIFRCRGYTYNEILNTYIDNHRFNSFLV